MKLPESTEWALHCVTALAQAPDEAVSAAQLAQHFALPAPYLSKQLALLVRAGVLSGTTGPRGGFRLSRPAAHVTLLDAAGRRWTDLETPTRVARSDSKGAEPRLRRNAERDASSPRRWRKPTTPGGRVCRR